METVVIWHSTSRPIKKQTKWQLFSNFLYLSEMLEKKGKMLYLNSKLIDCK